MANNKYSFKFLKNVTKPFVKIKYKLQIENSEIVPSEGPIIICSNHLHKRDQLSVYYSTNRTIHYMAKKEYFEHEPTKTLYKLWGAVPTDRQNGKESMDFCQKLLENNEAVGIFPEGTRNALKQCEIEEIYRNCSYSDSIDLKTFEKFINELRPKVSQINYLKELYNNGIISREQYEKNIINPDSFLLDLVCNNVIKLSDYDNSLLLPFKFGAVKLAQKTGATIITSAGDGNFNSGIVKFAYGDLFHIPHNSSDEEIQYYNNQIRDSIVKTYKKIR